MVKVVITGGPCSGKTTVVNSLRGMGFSTIPEVAGMLLKMGRRYPSHLEFHRDIVPLQLEFESRYPNNKLVFLDRGLPDGFAYIWYEGNEPPEEVVSLSKNRYDRVFFFDRLPFKNEGFRLEKSDEEAELIHRLVYKAYKSLGYKIERIPVLPVEERVRFVLRKLGIYPRY